MVRYLVTSALPYANGPIHFGQVVGAYLPADCYVRTLRMKGEEVCFVSGTDEHGVAITINAEAAGTSYADFVERWRDEAKRTFDRLRIDFDVWSGTSVSPHHAELSQEFFRRLDRNGYLIQRTGEQLYCPQDEMFLADRYVVGTCYVCGHAPARGDECPKCGTWLDTLRLVNPVCKVCGTTPERRTTHHWYLDLPKLRDEAIGAWFAAHPWKANVSAFVGAMLADLQARPVTRDMRWGVPVPADVGGDVEGKVIYVWFDAPIGYISFTREWAEAHGEPEAWKRFWCSEDTRLVHFIGKDNIPFHCLMFPSMLYGVKAGYVLPWQVPAMEFYNLQGRKFSTSTNWTIPPDEFLDRYDPDAARFYLLASLPETADSDFRWEEFQSCVNAGLADTIGNLVTRVLRFVAKHWDGRIPPLRPEDAEELDRVLLAECGTVEDPFESILEFRFRRATQVLLANAAVANVFVDRTAPWTLQKTDPDRAASVLNTACEWIALLARWMAPMLPAKAQELWTTLGADGPVAAAGAPGTPRPGAWRSLRAGTPIGDVHPPFEKIPDERVAAEIRALEERGSAG